MMAARTLLFIAATLVVITQAATPAAGQTPETVASPAVEAAEPSAADTAPDVHVLIRQFVGTWSIDVAALLGPGEWSDRDRALAQSLRTGTIFFGADGTMTETWGTDGDREQTSGRWILLEATSRSLRVQLFRGRPDPDVATLVFETPDRLVVNPDDVLPLPLMRAAEL